MTHDRRRRVEQLFQAALDLSGEARKSYLEEHCGDDEGLRAEVEQLLRHHERLGDFLRPMQRFSLGLLEDATAADDPLEQSLEPAASEIPETLGHYRIEREIGHGGMGVVYLAEDTKLGRKAAIKLLPGEFSHDPVRLRLFEREAHMAGSLNHPNIATIYEFDKSNDSYFIAMEYVEGRLLGELTKNGEPISVGEFLHVAIQIAEGLTAAHAKNIVHRDLKPGNLMITEERRVKILDFGLAKALQSDAPDFGKDVDGAAEMSTGCGTPGYSSPEQWNRGLVDPRSDLFSFGVVLYLLATGVAPFKGDSVLDMIHAVLRRDPEPPRALNSRLPPKIDVLIRKLLTKDAQGRHKSSATVLAKLRRIQRDYDDRKAGRRRRRPYRVLFGVGLLLAIVTTGWLVSDALASDAELLEWKADLRAGNGPEARNKQLALELGPADTELMELYELIERGELPDFRSARAAYQWDLDSSDERAFETLYAAKLETLLKDYEERLELSLSAGQFEEARAALKQTASLHADGSIPGRFQKRFDEADKLDRLTREDVAQAETALGSETPTPEQLEQVVRTINRLKASTFGKFGFKPATDGATKLSQALVGKLELLELSGLSADDLEDLERMVRRFDAESSMLDQFATAIEQAAGEEKLARWHRDAAREDSAAGIRKILENMVALARGHELTAEVARWAARRASEEERYGKGVEAFDRGLADSLEEIIAEFEVSETSSDGEKEKQRLAEASRWWDTYEESKTLVEQRRMEEAQKRLEALEEQVPLLPMGFRKGALDHCESLDERWRDARASIYCDSIERLCRLLQLERAKPELRALDELGIEETRQVREARGRYTSLLEEKDRWNDAEERDYLLFLRDLKDNRSNAEEALPFLESSWMEERTRIGRALELNEDLAAADDENRLDVQQLDTLRLRWVRLSIRLGDYSEAASEAEHLLPTVDGLLLRGQARVAAAPRNQEVINEALGEVQQALKKTSSNSQRARVLYLLGVFRLTLWELDPGNRANLRQAQRHLEEAIEDEGLESADAWLRLSAIHVEVSPEMGIRWAAEALTAPHTEEEVLVALGGNRDASKQARRFRRDCFYLKAYGHRLAEEWAECTTACSNAIELDGNYARAYARRSYARTKLGKNGEGLEDAKKVLQLVPDPQDPVLKKFLEWARTEWEL